MLLILVFTAISVNSKGQKPMPALTLEYEYVFKLIQDPPVCFVPTDFDLVKNYSPDIFLKDPFTKNSVPPKKVNQKIISSFYVVNNKDDSDSCYYFPGFYFTHVQLYKVIAGNLVPIPVTAPLLKDSVSFRLITIGPHDSLQIVAECYQLKTYTNVFRQRIINSQYIIAYTHELLLSRKDIVLFTYVFCGLLLMMVLYSIANFFQGNKNEFLFYALYALFLGFMLFTKEYYDNRSYQRGFFYEAYLDFVLQGAGICFFMAFMIRFLDTKKFHPFLHRIYKGGIIFLVIVLSLYTYMHYGTDNYYLENLLENYITKSILLVLIIVFLVYATRHWHNKLFRYLFWGNFLFLVFSLLSLFGVISRGGVGLPGIFSNALVLYETGLLIELIFFLIALTYKDRSQLAEQVRERERLKMENERKELEKQMAVMQAHQEERERISSDMHDELGSGMTSIRLMSEIAKNKMKENIPLEIEKISNSANDLLNKMNAIIWSMNSSNDTLDSLISYIRAYSIEFFEGTPIECVIKVPANIPLKDLSGDKRRNIFLCVKETLNNSLKHSKGNKVLIEIDISDKLSIKISDNGVGIDMEKLRRFGNGLKNITRRMKTIGGTYTIDNNNGTISLFELPL